MATQVATADERAKEGEEEVAKLSGEYIHVNRSLYIAIPTLETCIIYSQLIGTVKRSPLDEVYEDWIYTASGSGW